jgi:hypothetical protein
MSKLSNPNFSGQFWSSTAYIRFLSRRSMLHDGTASLEEPTGV